MPKRPVIPVPPPAPAPGGRGGGGRSETTPDWLTSENRGGSRFSDTLSATISKRKKKKDKKLRINLSSVT